MRWSRFTAQGSWPERNAAGLVIGASAYVLLTVILTGLADDAPILDLALLYLLATLVLAAVWGYWIGVAGAIAADLLVNFFFVPPRHTFTVQEPANVGALVLFLAVAVVGASMLALLRRQVRIAEARQAETAVLLRLSHEVSQAVSPQDALNALCRAVVSSLKARSCAIIQARGTAWEVVGASGGSVALTRDEEAVAAEAVRTGSLGRLGAQPRALRADDRSDAVTTFVPFGDGTPTTGVIRIRGAITVPPMADRDALLAAFASEASTALHRSVLAGEAARVEVLKRADEFKTVLLSSVSHDLRSPLTAIKAAVGSLRDESVDWSDDDRRSFLATIETQADRLTGTVGNLLEMSRLEGGAIRPTLEPIEVHPLLDELVEATRAATMNRPVVVEAAPGLWITADYGLVVQALQNLIENAAKYSIAGGAIRLAATPAAPWIYVIVADDGPGIAPDELPRIFEKFYRGSSAGESRGSGLGLAIVKAMVELCGGTIDVESSPSGTRFTLRFRAARQPAPVRNVPS